MGDSGLDVFRFFPMCGRDAEFQSVFVSRRLAFESACNAVYSPRFALLCEALVEYMILGGSCPPPLPVLSDVCSLDLDADRLSRCHMAEQ